MPGPTFIVGSLTYVADLNALSNAILTMQKQGINFAGVRGFWYVLTATGLQITLPIAPAAGDLIRVSPSNTTVLSVTLLRNGQPIDSTASDLTISSTADRDLNFWLLYVDASVGWRVIRNGVSGTLPHGGVKVGNFSASKNTQYTVDADNATVTLPASPAAGDTVVLAMATAARAGTILARNGSSINSVAADLTVAAAGQVITLVYSNAAIGWLAMCASVVTAAPHYEPTVHELRYHNTQRELAAEVGWTPWSLPIHAASSDTYATAQNLPISGGAIAVPIWVQGHALVESITYRNSDAASLRTMEFRLYKQRLNNGNAGENSLDEVAGFNGIDSFTPGAASNRTVALAAPVYLPPGVYWLVIRNTSGAQTFGVGTLATGGTLTTNASQTKTLGAGLGTPLDFVAAAWVKQVNVPGVRFNNRIFGQVAAF